MKISAFLLRRKFIKKQKVFFILFSSLILILWNFREISSAFVFVEKDFRAFFCCVFHVCQKIFFTFLSTQKKSSGNVQKKRDFQFYSFRPKLKQQFSFSFSIKWLYFVGIRSNIVGVRVNPWIKSELSETKHTQIVQHFTRWNKKNLSKKGINFISCLLLRI